MNKKADVIVIGLGAMGAAITYQLALRGLKVVGIDQFAPPHNHGSTHGETRITRQAIGEGLQFVPLARRSHQLWREIGEASGERIFYQCGGLILARTGHSSRLHSEKDFLGATIKAAGTYAITHELLDADEIAARYPQFELNGDELAYFEPEAGYLNPEAAVAVQLRLAEKLGATLITGHPATIRRESGHTFVKCNSTQYSAYKTVVAAGPWVPHLLPELSARLRVSRQLLFWFGLDGSVSYSPDEFPVFIWNWGSGESDVFYGFPQVGRRPEIKIATEQHLTTTTPDTIERQVSDSEIAEMAQRHIVGKLRGVTSECLRAAACLYTSTDDSNFIIDWLPNRGDILVVSACSGHGFKHSAAIGEAVAEMVATGTAPEILLPFAIE